jgi:hypothetical protein
MTDPAFVGAGQKAGLELWRIEALKPVKIPQVYYFRNNLWIKYN